MSADPEEEETIDTLKARMKHPILREFADYLDADEKYSIGDMEHLLLEEWGGAYPTALPTDDLLVDIGSFLYNMGAFVLEKGIGNSLPKVGGQQLYFSTVPDPSYEGTSHVYVVESTTRTLLAEYSDKTWTFCPDAIADALAYLESQMKRGWELVQRRVLALNLLGNPVDMPNGGSKADGRSDNASADHS